MKVIIVGGTGTIGRAIAKEIGKRHEIIIAASKGGDTHVDITDVASIEKMYKTIKQVDAVVVAAGRFQFAEFASMKPEDYHIGLNNKLMGQVNMVLMGREHLKDGGSFTLTSGCLSHDPVRNGTSGSMVNAALNGFVHAAAIEMPRGLRINIVSPTIIEESKHHYEKFFRGFEPIPAARVALAYSKSVEGGQTGQVYHVG